MCVGMLGWVGTQDRIGSSFVVLSSQAQLLQAYRTKAHVKCAV